LSDWRTAWAFVTPSVRDPVVFVHHGEPLAFISTRALLRHLRESQPSFDWKSRTFSTGYARGVEILSRLKTDEASE
jgi:hypothetical protein